jgi:uncharacterized membrane protein
MDKVLKKIIWPIIAAPAAYLALVWNRLPEVVPVNYNLRGEADEYGSKNELLLVAAIITGVSVLMYLIISNVYRIDPKKYAVENKTKLHRLAFAISVFMSALLCVFIYSTDHGETKMMTRLGLAAVGLLFSIIGNYMYTIKPNYFAGIRLPWTLENEENWKKTHLLAGKLFFAGGLAVTAISFIIPVAALYAVFIVVTVIITLIPCIYSFLLYKKQKRMGKLTK